MQQFVIMRGNTSYSLDQLRKISEVLNCGIFALIGNEHNFILR